MDLDKIAQFQKALAKVIDLAKFDVEDGYYIVDKSSSGRVFGISPHTKKRRGKDLPRLIGATNWRVGHEAMLRSTYRSIIKHYSINLSLGKWGNHES